jgi:hypothetical protein
MKPTLKVGDEVTYNDINLRNYFGVIVAIQQGEKGGDCRVKWTRPARVETEDCLNNLKAVP